jgi:hypothetical protein
MIEQEPLVPLQWDIETDVVVARLVTGGRHTASDPLRAVAAHEPGEGGKII